MPDIPIVAAHLRRQRQEEAEELRQAKALIQEAAEAEKERQAEAQKSAQAIVQSNRRVRESVERDVIGPYQRAAQLRQQLTGAEANSAPDALKNDLRFALDAAEKRIARFEASQKPSSLQDRLGNALANSRIGGGGIRPLLGNVAEVAGVGPEALGKMAGNPLLIGAELIYEGSKRLARAIVETADAAADAARHFSAERLTAGTDTAGGGRLRAYGLDAGATRSLQDRITSDPIAMMFAQRVGVTAVGGPYGTLDSAKTTLDLIRGLRTLEGEEQVRAVRALGVEYLGPLLKVSQRTINRLEKDAETNAKIFDKVLEGRAAEYDVAKQRVASANENLTSAVGERFLEPLTRLFNMDASLRNILAEYFKVTGQAEDAILKALGPLIYPLGNPFEALGGSSGGGNGDALSDNTAELKNTQIALSRLTRVIGGGERANSAIPSAFLTPGRPSGEAILRHYESGALRMGVL